MKNKRTNDYLDRKITFFVSSYMLNRTREQELYQSKTAQKETHCILLKIRLQVFLKVLTLRLQLIYLFPMFQTLSKEYFFCPINIFGGYQ
jgi:hypothetical protein